VGRIKYFFLFNFGSCTGGLGGGGGGGGGGSVPRHLYDSQ
jgi:hypothetical protein